MTNNKFQLKAIVNGLTISTVKIGKIYETMVFDQIGNELKVMTANYKNDAKHNHMYCVAHYVSPKNCIHAI